MPKDTKKKKPAKANPLLDEDVEETDTDAVEAEDEVNETDTDTDEADADEEEVEDEPAKKPAKAASKAVKTDAEIDEDIAPKRDTPKVRAKNSVEAEMLTDIEVTKRKLAAQPKVRIFIPLGIGEKKGGKGVYETVTINGYRQVLPKGEYVTVAQSVADQIEKHYNMSPENTEVGQAYRLDRPRFKDGMSTDEALS